MSIIFSFLQRIYLIWTNPSCVCQNCDHANNIRGKFTIHRYKRTSFRPDKKYWHILCEKKQRFFAWDDKKRCYSAKQNKSV